MTSDLNSWSPGTIMGTTGQSLPQSRQDDRPAPMTVELTQAQQASRVAQKNDVVAQAFKLISTVRDAQRAYNAEIHASEHLNEEGKRAALAAFASSQEAQVIPVAERAVTEWIEQKQERVQKLRTDLVQPGDAAQEARNDRAWARAKHAIDRAQEDPSGASTVTAARQAIANARNDELGVLINEVPPYLESLGLPTSFLDAEVRNRVPELADAQMDLANAQRDATVVKYDLNAVKKGIETGTPPTYLVDPAKVENRPAGDQSAVVK
jgi:hypothetical protein